MTRSKTLAAFTVATALFAASVATGQARDGTNAASPVAHAAATCSEYPNQKAAQEAADTRDADGDGIYCVIYSR